MDILVRKTYIRNLEYISLIKEGKWCNPQHYSWFSVWIWQLLIQIYIDLIMVVVFVLCMSGDNIQIQMCHCKMADIFLLYLQPIVRSWPEVIQVKRALIQKWFTNAPPHNMCVIIATSRLVADMILFYWWCQCLTWSADGSIDIQCNWRKPDKSTSWDQTTLCACDCEGFARTIINLLYNYTTRLSIYNCISSRGRKKPISY